jgi:folate-dependent phosphoribosylglycinamide formyltransferase PurN
MINNFIKESKIPLKGAIFISGSGTNAEKILENRQKNSKKNWEPVVIITDRPETSKAFEIGSKFDIPVIALDIRQFYNERGETKISIISERGRAIREEWTNTLRKMLAPYSINFGILAGFVLMTNITNDFPCLNVHPGDLTVEENGERLLVGLHTIPIEIAILKGYKSLRSSVIIAQAYSGAGAGMDSGPVLGISTSVDIEFYNNTFESLKEIASNRPASRPTGGYKDILEDVASKNQERLKTSGDWVVFPQVVEDFAAGYFGYTENEPLMFNEKNTWKKIRTVEYGINGKKIIYEA